MKMSDLADLMGELDGVRRTTKDGLVQWRYRGRLVARQLDDTHVVIRADFDYRDVLLRQSASTFSVPTRFAKHMMVVADLASSGDGAPEDGASRDAAIEDALLAAHDLQRRAD